MHRYILKRIAMLLLVMLGVSLLIFFIMDLAPGDQALMILGEAATEEELNALREELGLFDPFFVRYGRYMWNFLQGDLGYSHKYLSDVLPLYLERLGATVVLALASALFAHILSIPMGIYAALHQGKVSDNIVSALAIVGLAAPNFWVGLLLIILFSLKLGMFHSGGFVTLSDVVLPAITVGTANMALLTRTTRSGMIDVLRSDYLMLARAKGVSEKMVVRKHALKNALIPIITVSGIQFSAMMGGAVTTEAVFSFPGIGTLLVGAIKSKDTVCVTGCLIMTSLLVSVTLLLVDILYAYVDPRIKAQYSK